MELILPDALGIFRGWKESASPVTFFFDNDEVLIKIRGVVTQVMSDEIVIANDDARARVGFRDAEFQYQDRRGGRPVLRQISEADFVSCIEVHLHGECKCLLFELES